MPLSLEGEALLECLLTLENEMRTRITHGDAQRQQLYEPTYHSFFVPSRVPVVLYPDGDAGEMITKQSFKEECDIHTILAGYERTGQLEHVNAAAASGAYLDLPDVMDYQEHLAAVEHASAAFSALPSELRDHYQNSPAQFLVALQDPSERDNLQKWGVLRAPPPPEPPPVVPSSGGGDAAPK